MLRSSYRDTRCQCLERFGDSSVQSAGVVRLRACHLQVIIGGVSLSVVSRLRGCRNGRCRPPASKSFATRRNVTTMEMVVRL
ncbi:uncharacterized protein M421DRAFT_125799 [Didymella exigua CBS 183.55]|uniref:Uncharacterized protein n=1 Tax=Didymella exigua CBS 183.55 TaxID=1150837 RepID=A0A6A5RPQ9_9PLEO|nr:uncharacterized protein M421DRAFT_125799 [Didymella exigua CBS 183.55]KAF1929639.1 hypothetical protein M421DRAFT_125799 [Didymella exigua CBS 183.55]